LKRVTLAGHKLHILLGLLGLGFGIFELHLKRVTLADRKLARDIVKSCVQEAGASSLNSVR
jgi:hypothetical protein